MNRRTTISLVLVLLITVSGCLSAVPDIGGIQDNFDSGPAGPDVLEHPTPPETWNAETAGQFAARYEEVSRHNSILGANENVVDLGTKCEVVDTEEINGQYRVSLECGHWYEFEDAGKIGIADGAPYTASYVVSNDGVLSVARSGP